MLLHSALSFVLVGAIWGCTNPFLKEGTSDIQAAPKKDSRIAQIVSEIYMTLTNWKVSLFFTLISVFFLLITITVHVQFIIPFALNQSGSAVYYYLLGTSGTLVCFYHEVPYDYLLPMFLVCFYPNLTMQIYPWQSQYATP